MSTKLIYAAGAIAALIATYALGYSHAKAKGEANLKSLEVSHAQAIVETQETVKNEYEQKIAQLSADLADVRSANTKRLRQLEAFSRASGDLEACRRDRSELGELAVTGEGLLREADSYIRALQQ